MINEAAYCLAEGIVASPAKLDLAMIFGTGFPPFRGGLCAHADALGATAVVEALQKLAKEKGGRFAPAPLLIEMATHEQEILRMRGAEMSTVKDETSPSPRPPPKSSRSSRRSTRGTSPRISSSPIPEIPADVKETVAAFADAWTDFDAAHLDSEKMDARAPLPARGRQGHGRARRPRDDDPRGVRRQRLQRGRVLPDDGDGRAARRVGLDRDRRPPVDRHQARRPLRERGAEEEVAPRPRVRQARRRVLPHGARGGLGRGLAEDDRRLRRRDGHVRPERDEAVDLERRVRDLLHGLRAHPVGRRRTATRRVSCFAVVTNPDGTLPGLTRGPEEKKLGLCASSTCQIIFENCRIPAANLIGEKGHGFKSPSRRSTRAARRSARARSAARRWMIKLAVEHATQRKQFKTAHRRLRDDPPQDHEDDGDDVRPRVDGLPDREPRRPAHRLFARGRLLQGVRDRGPLAEHQRRPPDRGRQRLHERVPVRARSPRQPHQHDLRGDERDPPPPDRAVGHEGARRLAQGGPERPQEPARAARHPDRVRPQAHEGRHHARQAHEGPPVARARGRPGRPVRGHLRERLRDDPAQARQEGHRPRVPAGAHRGRPDRPLRPDRDALARDLGDREEGRGEGGRRDRDRPLVLQRGQAPDGREPQGARAGTATPTARRSATGSTRRGGYPYDLWA